MAPTIGLLARTYYSWKALRLPWRKRFFMGHDLQGNTYWEFKLTSSETRLRRIVKYPRSIHPSEVIVPPPWHQWLRHTRVTPPTVEEQHADVARRERTKLLAAEADARWEAKPRIVTDGRGGATAPRPALGSAEQSAAEDPWAQAGRASGPGETWQPAAWDPSKR